MIRFAVWLAAAATFWQPAQASVFTPDVDTDAVEIAIDAAIRKFVSEIPPEFRTDPGLVVCRDGYFLASSPGKYTRNRSPYEGPSAEAVGCGPASAPTIAAALSISDPAVLETLTPLFFFSESIGDSGPTLVQSGKRRVASASLFARPSSVSQSPIRTAPTGGNGRNGFPLPAAGGGIPPASTTGGDGGNVFPGPVSNGPSATSPAVPPITSVPANLPNGPDSPKILPLPDGPIFGEPHKPGDWPDLSAPSAPPVSAVPVPASVLWLLSGLAALVGIGWRKGRFGHGPARQDP